MASTSLSAISAPLPRKVECNSQSLRWTNSKNSRQIPCRSVFRDGQCRMYRKFSKLSPCSSSPAFGSQSLSFLTRCPDVYRKENQCDQARIPGPSRKGGNRLVGVYCVVTEKVAGGTQLNASTDQSVRRLILLRHAKSSWTDRTIKDHERPLSKRGRQAAANIASKLFEQSGWEPQLILCSDSTRTRETLNIMQQHFVTFLEGEVRYFSSFYSVAAMDGQTVQHLRDIICRYSKDDVTTIMCMGHNRGWEEAASLLSGVNVELKTANAALLETRGSSWQEAFERAGMGGWKLVGIVKPDTCGVEGAVQ